MALFTLEELASYLQSDLDTATATQARTKATNYLRAELGVEFAEASRTLVERVTTTRTYQHLIGPLVSVESVEVDGVALVEVTDWERTNRGIVCPAGFGAGIATNASWVDLEVTYTAGFEDPLPTGNEDLHDAALHLAGLAYLRSPSPGVTSSTVTVEGVTLAESYTADAPGARDAVTLDESTLRSLRARYGSARPKSGTVLIR